jgi:hypothetical protein
MIKTYLITAWVNQKPIIFTENEDKVEAGDWRAAFARAMALIKKGYMKKGSRPEEITIKLINTRNV